MRGREGRGDGPAEDEEEEEAADYDGEDDPADPVVPCAAAVVPVAVAVATSGHGVLDVWFHGGEVSVCEVETGDKEMEATGLRGDIQQRIVTGQGGL